MNSIGHADEKILGSVLEIDLHGKLNPQDYEAFVPEIEHAIGRHKETRVLVAMHDFDGWAAGAAWNEIKWNAKHFNHVDRLAIVGEKAWHRWMTNFCRAFPAARVRYFTFEQLEEAHEWLNRR